jgi:hypothetical protein
MLMTMLVGAWLALGVSPVAPVGGGNALTLPAQRHMVWVEPGNGPGVLLLAMQQGGREGRGLGLFRSDDEGRSWRYVGPIQDDASHQDRADLLRVGRDVALVYSLETPASQGIGGSPRHDVYFQWWRYQPSRGQWAPERPVKVFDSVSPDTAYYRAELARDSRGRLWVQAFRREPHGRASVVVAVSQDGGATFQRQPLLDEGLRFRGGGRLISLGSRLLLLYDMHDAGHPARFRIRDDADPPDVWEPVREAFPEGIYQGAALSAVADGKGGLHLVYKDEASRLNYRHFDGRRFGPREMLEQGDWAMQPALSRVGDALVVFFNRKKGSGRGYELRMRRGVDGRFGPSRLLDGTPRFKGYPGAAEQVPLGVDIPCAYGSTRDAAADGQVMVALAPPLGARQDEEDHAPGAPVEPDETPVTGAPGGVPPATDAPGEDGSQEPPGPQDGLEEPGALGPEGTEVGCGGTGLAATLSLAGLGLLARWGRRQRRSLAGTRGPGLAGPPPARAPRES